MKILIVGLGSIGQRHVRLIRETYGDAVELIAYRVRGLHHTFSDNMQIRDGVVFEEEYHITSYYDLDEALAQKPKVVFITNITSEHISTAIKAAKAGCDLFIEKPLSFSLDGIKELQRIVHDNHLIVSVGFQNRHHICLKRLKEVIEAKVIGELVSVDIEMGERLATMHTYEDYRGTYMAQKKMGGGVILNQQIHELDYLLWIFGMPKSVYSISGHLSDLDIDVEDTCSSLYTLEKNGKEIPIYVHADFLQHPPSRRCKVIGTNGFIEVDLLRLDVFIQTNNDDLIHEQYHSFNRNDMFLAEQHDFFACVNDRKKPVVSLDVGVQSLKMALAAIESARKKNVISINDIN